MVRKNDFIEARIVATSVHERELSSSTTMMRFPHPRVLVGLGDGEQDCATARARRASYRNRMMSIFLVFSLPFFFLLSSRVFENSFPKTFPVLMTADGTPETQSLESKAPIFL